MSLKCPERNGTLTEDIDPTNFQHNYDYVHNLCAREKHSMKQNTKQRIDCHIELFPFNF